MKENIKKFIDAQNAPGFSGYANAQKELIQGKKLSHWIWYVFPKLKAISQDSPYERQYGIESLQEAKEYLEDSTLRSRLEEVCTILLKHQGKTASGIFGFTDAGKVRSSMTLFYLASNDAIFKQVLDKYYNGVPCQDTLYALNMSMPRKGEFDAHNDNQKDGHRDSKTHSTKNKVRTKGKVSGTTNKGKNPSKARKFKKVAILLVGFVVIVGIFGGVGYGAYSMLIKGQQRNQEEKLAQNSFPESKKKLIKEKNLIITLVTSDNIIIDSEDLDKYFIQTSAPLSGNTCLMDTVTNTYNLQYTKDNCNEDIAFNVSIEGCTIGERIFSYQGLDDTKDAIKEELKLSVSSIDLRIYEELAWYVSVNRHVTEAKYPKYIDRIKSVKDENFAALLTKKLKTIGTIEHQVEKKSTKEDNDAIPAEIKKDIMMTRPISMSMAKNLNTEYKRIISEYNRWVVDVYVYRKDRRDIIRKQLASCRTFTDLRHIIRKYEKDSER